LRLKQLLILLWIAADSIRQQHTHRNTSLSRLIVFTHPSDKKGYEVNINSDAAVPLPFCLGPVSAVFGLLSSSTMSLSFILPSIDKSALNGGQGLSPETTYHGFVAVLVQ
jgi:hypothetical protein